MPESATGRPRGSRSYRPYPLSRFREDFADEDACLRWLWRRRFAPDGMHAVCPRCGRQRAFRRYPSAQRRRSWTCTTCGLHLQPTAGTIFAGSSTPLPLWFYAVYLMASTRCEISARQLQRELGVTYKTAWRMSALIRERLTRRQRAARDASAASGHAHGAARAHEAGAPAPGGPSEPL
jgi:transposase-like protein